MTDGAMPIERWLPVPGYEGAYEVSDHGRVRSADRIVTTSSGPRRYRSKVLRPGRTSCGYHHVNLTVKGVGRSRLIHQLVAEAFLGPRPIGMEVRHGPAGIDDDGVDNLSWGTSSENHYDKVRDGTDHQRNKTDCLRGHALAPPNLIRWHAARGHRGCLACSRAYSKVYHARRKGIVLDLPAEADRYYAVLMGANTA